MNLKGHAHWLSLRFKDPKVESAFHNAEEAFSPLSLLGGPLVMVCSAPVWRYQPWGPFTWGGIGVVVLFAVVLAGATCLGSSIKAMWLRRALASLMVFSLGLFLLLDMVRRFKTLAEIVAQLFNENFQNWKIKNVTLQNYFPHSSTAWWSTKLSRP